MSQKIIYDLIEELGGEATTKQIKELALKRYPNLTLHTYVKNRLKKLENFGYVKKTISDRVEMWKIVRKFE